MSLKPVFASLIGSTLLLASCGTPEFRAERSECQSAWLSKIPPDFVQRIVNESRTRQVPTGQTICNQTGTQTICNAVMRTEYYTVPVVRTIDRNKPRRDVQVKACTQKSCIKRFGNPECKPA